MRIRHPLLSLAVLVVSVAMSLALVYAAGQFSTVAMPALLSAGGWLRAHHLLPAFTTAIAILPGLWVMVWVIPAAQKAQARRAQEGDPRVIRRLPFTFGQH